jgi:hypothetical protein
VSNSIDDLKKRYNSLKQLQYETEDKANDFANKAFDLATKMINASLGRDEPEYYYPETWECDKSPTGYCAYDFNGDPCHDDCLFCHQPEERK